MSWLSFFAGLPFVTLGFIVQWVLDMFQRGRDFYDYISE